VFAYEGIIAKAIKRLKYNFATDLSKRLVEISVTKFPDILKANSRQMLIPIPLHSRRERWRGFNHASILGKLVAYKMNVSFNENILTRTKNTIPQVGLPEEQRRENIKEAFALKTNRPALKNFNIILFDDVWTTGSTLKEACKILKRNGAKNVWGLTIAG